MTPLTIVIAGATLGIGMFIMWAIMYYNDLF